MFLCVFLASGREVACNAIGQGLAMGPTASDVVHGVVRARQLDVETGVGRREDEVVQGGELFVGVLLRGDQVDEGDAPVLVRLTERYTSIQEAAA